jgi:hypothetical protein
LEYAELLQLTPRDHQILLKSLIYSILQLLYQICFSRFMFGIVVAVAVQCAFNLKIF